MFPCILDLVPPDLHIVQEAIEAYLDQATPERDPICTEMEALAREKGFPIVGPLVGRLLYILSSAIGATRILELGSGYGYSAYWFARGTPASAVIVCTDQSEENHKLAASFFRRAGISEKIDFRVGEALSILENTEGPLDIIFNDINKEDYPKAFAKAIPRIRKGGLLITDNVLWKGRILDSDPDAQTRGVLDYNRMMYTSNEVLSAIIPLRDGVAVSIKL